MYLYAMILVTGATGLVGRHLLVKLASQKKQIVALYRTAARKKEVEDFFAFAKAKKELSFITWKKADLTDIPALNAAFENVDYVYHCAANISFDPYQFSNLIKVNVEGTQNIVNLCLSNNIKKLCHVSSIATLSKLPNNPINEENHWDPNEENSVYAISKYGSETEVWRGSQEGLSIIIFNPGVILGEGNIQDANAIFFKQGLKKIIHYTDGGTGFIDVKDLVELLIKGMESSIQTERYIAVGHNLTYEEVLRKIATHFQKTPKLKSMNSAFFKSVSFIDKILGIVSRKRRLPDSVVATIQDKSLYDTSKTEADLGFAPTAIDDSIRRICSYFCKIESS